MSLETLDEFNTFYLLPHLIVYYIYIVIKYILLIYAWLRFISSKYSGKMFSYFCCCCCCQRSCNYCFMLQQWIIKLLLGREASVVKRFNTYKDDEYINGIPTLYIRNKRLTPGEISVLALLIITFSLLILITAFDLFFINITYVCTNNPGIYCFVTDLNITNKRITDCQHWNNKSEVTIVCFQWAYNSKATIAAVGGLITFFQYTVRIITEISIALNGFLAKNCCTKHILKILRKAFALIIALAEICFALLLIYFFLKRTHGKENVIIAFFLRYGNQLLLLGGILGTCLFLPLEEYASSVEQQFNLMEHQTHYGSTLINQQQPNSGEYYDGTVKLVNS